MGSKQTTLVIANLTEFDITDISTLVRENGHWDGDSRPDRNFNNVALGRYDARGEREELEAGWFSTSQGEYDMKLTFSNGETFAFNNHQHDALDKHRRIIASNDSFEVCQSAGDGSNGLEIRRRGQADNADWMGKLLGKKPNVKLNELTMPGSHDSGMYQAHGCGLPASEGTTKTQTDDFANQLADGVRFFDVRIMWDDNDYYTYHGEDQSILVTTKFVGCLGGKLSDILAQTQAFLTGKGRQETVLFDISHTHGSVKDRAALARYFTDHCPAYCTSTQAQYAHLKLADTKGKVLLLFADEFQGQWDPSKGILPWRDENATGYGMRVYNRYADKQNINDLRNDQLPKLQDRGGYGQDYLFLLAWTLTGKVGTIVDIMLMGSLVRPWLPKELARMKRGELKKPNVVNLDFTDRWVCAAIIDLNY